MDLSGRTTAPRMAPWISLQSGPTIKAALFLGFGLICATWVFAGYYFTQRMADLQRRATSINARYMKGQELLTTARGQVLIGSVYVRDALLDPDPRNWDAYREKLKQTYGTADDALREYVPVADTPIQRERITRLRTEINEFRDTVLKILAAGSDHWPTEARSLLVEQILPKREGVIRVADEVQALNRTGFVQQQTEIAAVYRATQRRLWGSFGVAVVVSFGIALLATIYAGRLEYRIHRQRQKEAENARNLQRLSTKVITAQEEERRAIARELHDEVGQALTAIKVELSIAERAIEAAGGPTEVLDDARAITDATLHTVRDLSHLLHPALLDDLGLAAAVDSYLKGFGKRHGIRVELLQNRLDTRLRSDTEAAAFRIVQEALTNVARHAHASRCRVHLQLLSSTLSVSVEDDGVGFEPVQESGRSSGTGLGLLGIRERVSRLGGTLRLETGPGKGTRLIVELPAPIAPDDDPAVCAERDAASAVPQIPEVLRG